MRKNIKSKTLNDKGFASIEAVSLLGIFLVMLAYGMGAFGVVHTGIVNSIAARAYAFETMRQRANVTYFRDINLPPEHYKKLGYRFHGIISERQTEESKWIATERNLAVGRPIEPESSRSGIDTDTNISGPERKSAVNPVWIKTIYGICLDAACGGT